MTDEQWIKLRGEIESGKVACIDLPDGWDRNENYSGINDLIAFCRDTRPYFANILHRLMWSLRIIAEKNGKTSMYIEDILAMNPGVDKAKELAIGGLLNESAHHKQWYIERVLEALGVDLEQLRKDLQREDYDWEDGIAP